MPKYSSVPHKADIATYIVHDVIIKLQWSFQIGRVQWGLRTLVITSAFPRADYINYTNASRDLPVPVSRFYPLIFRSHSRSPPTFIQSCIIGWDINLMHDVQLCQGPPALA